MFFDEDFLGKLKACLLKQGITYLKQFNQFLKAFEELQEENLRLKEELKQIQSEIERLKGKEEKQKEDAKRLRKLFAWYLSLWENEPPEKYRFEKWNQVLGRNFKKLLKIFSDEKELMEEYEAFLRLYKDFTASKKFSHEENKFLYKLFTDGGIVNFASKLSIWMQYRKKFLKSFTKEEEAWWSELEKML